MSHQSKNSELRLEFFFEFIRKCEKYILYKFMSVMHACIMKISRSQIRKCVNTRVNKCETKFHVLKYTCVHLRILVSFRAINNQTWTHFIWYKITNWKLSQITWINSFHQSFSTILIEIHCKEHHFKKFFLCVCITEIGHIWINCKKTFWYCMIEFYASESFINSA